MVAARRSKLRKSALDAGFRSGLEQDNAAWLKKNNVGFEYEKLKIKWVSAPHTYTPDFVLDNGIIIEAKGRFVGSERAKHLAVKKQHPELDIRFVFSNSGTRLSKGSKTTYGSWCQKHGFQYSDAKIPVSWMKEKPK
jgi:hypothetical protein